MAKYIEMVGAAGVGKTTTYNYLLKQQRGLRKGKFYEDMDRLRNRILKRDFILRKLGFRAQETSAVVKDHSLTFVKKNPELMELFWESVFSVSSTTQQDIRFHRVNYLKKIMYKIQRVKEDPVEDYYILDEGLIHNCHYFAGKGPEEDLEGSLLNILSRTDPPAGIIFFEADVDTILERTLYRKKKLGGEIGLSIKELKRIKQNTVNQWSKGIDLLENQMIPVLRLNARETVRIKAEEINNFLFHLKTNDAEVFYRNPNPNNT